MLGFFLRDRTGKSGLSVEEFVGKAQDHEEEAMTSARTTAEALNPASPPRATIAGAGLRRRAELLQGFRPTYYEHGNGCFDSLAPGSSDDGRSSGF